MIKKILLKLSKLFSFHCVFYVMQLKKNLLVFYDISIFIINFGVEIFMLPIFFLQINEKYLL